MSSNTTVDLKEQHRIYHRLHKLGKSFNETLEISQLYDVAIDFTTNDLQFEKCLIFEHDDNNGWFKVVRSVGYDNPMEQKVLTIINLLLSGEVIEYLRVHGDPIIHTQENPSIQVQSLAKSLFLSEGYFELFGGDVNIPFGLIVVGNGLNNIENRTQIMDSSNNVIMMALDNFTMQISNTINNIIFYKAWKREKDKLEENIVKRTQEIEDQKKTFEAIYKTSKDGIAILDLETTAFLTVNQAYAEITGYTKEELKRTSCLKLSLEEDQEKSKIALEKVISQGYIQNFEKRCLAKDNTIVIVSMSIVLMDDKKRILVSAKDITEQKKLEKNLLDAKQKAEESTKSKAEFLANMSHEIRTPMNGIIGMAHLALQTELSDKQRNYIQKIDTSANSLLGIINDILDFSKIEAGKLKVEKVNFDLFQVVDSVVHLLELKAHEKNIEIIVSYDLDVGKNFYGDSLRLSQILTNLIGNAIKFTEIGEIGIYITKVDKNKYQFKITDTGIGLTDEQQSTLFQSFSQADGSTTRKYGGTGLGLSISKQLVEMMNGAIWINSQYGIGSQFIFNIELEGKECDKKRNLLSNKKILIVDDNQSWHTILSNNLEAFDIKVDHAYSGRESIEKLFECKNTYDLVLMDWNMPQLDGIETTRIIKNMCQSCSKKTSCKYNLPPTVVMVSSYRQESIVKLAKDVGIDIFLQKPINPSTLHDILSGVFFKDVNIVDFVKKEKKSLIKEINTLQGSNILLVEDNHINQEIILGLLENSGIHIDLASNGSEAVELFHNNPTKYELIIMDIQMPIMDGYKATKIIRNSNQDIPIIALTANAMIEDIQKTKNSGMQEHLNKPIDVEKLYATLLKYLSKKTKLLQSSNNTEEIEIPIFKQIDTDVGLKYLAGNKKLYLKILNDFYKDYKDIKLKDLDDETLEREVHTLKGLSSNIGAIHLSAITKELESSQNKELILKVHEQLDKVLMELKSIENKNKTNVEYLAITVEKRDELFEKLLEVSKTKLPKKCEPILEELSHYKLDEKDRELFEEIKKLIKKYKFKAVVSLLEGK